jgi:hypothetical protein
MVHEQRERITPQGHYASQFEAVALERLVDVCANELQNHWGVSWDGSFLASVDKDVLAGDERVLTDEERQHADSREDEACVDTVNWAFDPGALVLVVRHLFEGPETRLVLRLLLTVDRVHDMLNIKIDIEEVDEVDKVVDKSKSKTY